MGLKDLAFNVIATVTEVSWGGVDGKVIKVSWGVGFGAYESSILR